MTDLRAHIYEFGDFRVDAAKPLLMGSDDQTLALTPKVFDTLLYLVKSGGKYSRKKN
jgi:DNA-binding response OmpR family regulator